MCVIGLGTVGYPTAEYIAKHGFEVIGYDIINKPSKTFIVTDNWDRIPKDVDVYVITVPTLWDEKIKSPDLSALHDACSKISRSNKDALVSIESTVPVGTCRNVAKMYGLKYVVHVPHRYWAGDPVKYGVRQLRVFGALNEESKRIGLDFYKKLDIPLHVCSSIEIAEMCKIVENAYRFVQIAFVEEVKMICDALGLNFSEVREACNTKWNVQLLEARNGIGGECLPKDIRYLIRHAEDSLKHCPLLKGAVRTDELFKDYIRRRSKDK